MVWIAVAPVPMMPTRFPLIALASAGHLDVWNPAPLKSCTPGMLGRVGWFRMPMAVIRKRAVYVFPVSSVSNQELEASRHRAEDTRVLNCISS